MSHVVVEHIILIPLMIVLVVIFPVSANYVAVSYANQQREVMADGAMNQVTSTLQQLSYSLSQTEIQPCNITMTEPLPRMIDSYTYNLSASMSLPQQVTLQLTLPGLNFQTNKTMTLTSNIQWLNSEYCSRLPDARLLIEKLSNGTIIFSFA